VLQQLLPALARVFALPAQQSQPAASSGSASQGEHLQQRLLAVQLEALHVLLLVLPLPCTARLPDQLVASGAEWPSHLRQGLALLLRSRISAVQRHSALQLAAAVVELLGPEWLLGGPAGSSGKPGTSSGSGSGDSQPATAAAGAAADVEVLFQLLIEYTKVETSVLLHDALAPDVQVPLASAPGTAAGDWRAPAPRQPAAGDGACSSDGGSEAGDGDDAAGAELAADLAGGGEDGEGGRGASADIEPLVRVLESEGDRQRMEGLMRKQHEAAAAAAGQQQEQQPGQQGDHVKLVDATPIPTGTHGWCLLFVLCMGPAVHGRACPV
jgi:hypothetical protein